VTSDERVLAAKVRYEWGHCTRTLRGCLIGEGQLNKEIVVLMFSSACCCRLDERLLLLLLLLLLVILHGPFSSAGLLPPRFAPITQLHGRFLA
jgi:hypothetical protein